MNGMPWHRLYEAGWRIVGMNHYNLHGEPHLFCAMSKDGYCIVAEGVDEALVFVSLEIKAQQSELLYRVIEGDVDSTT